MDTTTFLNCWLCLATVQAIQPQQILHSPRNSQQALVQDRLQCLRSSAIDAGPCCT